MTRSDLIHWISSEQKDFLQSDIDMAIRVVLDYLSESLALGQRIEVRGFGSFSLKYRTSRRARNPKTGESITLTSKYIPYFKASKALFRRMNPPHT
ncbi:MAG: integration host factor subunit beta [Gammaproteobacteria bacterium]|nr:integration host factor subunit beta [Gammaproteobacteria bacterium]